MSALTNIATLPWRMYDKRRRNRWDEIAALERAKEYAIVEADRTGRSSDEILAEAGITIDRSPRKKRRLLWHYLNGALAIICFYALTLSLAVVCMTGLVW